MTRVQQVEEDEVNPADAAEESEDLLTSSDEKLKLREKLNADVEAFLQHGGQVTVVANNVRADPPKKPNINYGAGPI